jgi:hypothetical protein
MEPVRIPAGKHTADPGWLKRVRPTDAIYFLLNVGDADAQVLVLPEVQEDPARPGGRRRAIVVDAGTRRKVPALLDELGNHGLLETQAVDGRRRRLTSGTVALAVATHPHQDHIGGMAQLLRDLGSAVAEFWDPGYFHTLGAYHRMMRQIEDRPDLLYTQPTSGLRRWIGDAQVTVLSPSIQLRNRYDTYGVEVNDSSISLRVEWPAARVVQDDAGRRIVWPPTSSIILGADAQTLSWSYVLTDFPYLAASQSEVAKALKAATGGDPLRSNVLKISHHCSKHGVNLELVERISPAFTLISSLGTGGSYGFPHSVAQELIREALDATTKSGRAHPPDWKLRIFYTSDLEDTPPTSQALGSIALVMGSGKKPRMYRFGDRPTDLVKLDNGRRWAG